MSVGWIIVSFFSAMTYQSENMTMDYLTTFAAMFVGLGMAEIVSAIPTSGGPYFWAAILAPQHVSAFASWVTGWFVKTLSSQTILLVDDRQVQSARSGSCHYRYHLWPGEFDLHNSDRGDEVCAHSWEDSRNLRCSSLVSRSRQFFWCPSPALPKQHINHYAFCRYQLFLHCRPGESPKSSIRQVRLRDFLRWNWRHRRWLERSSVARLCCRLWCSYEPVHYHRRAYYCILYFGLS